MARQDELQFNYQKIDETISKLKILQNRAMSCSRVQLFMDTSEGNAKQALKKTHREMSSVANCVAKMIEDSIVSINEAAKTMKQEDKSLAQSILKGK